MTCIAGIVDKGVVWIGGDSAGSDYYTRDVYKNKKVFINDSRFLIGFTSTFRFGDLLKHALSIPQPRVDQDLTAYMYNDFINALRKTLKDNGHLTVKSGVESGGTALIGYDNRLFTLQDDFSLLESSSGYSAVGSGNELALGSMHTTNDFVMKPKERIQKALQAASDLTPYVSPPFTILSL